LLAAGAHDAYLVPIIMKKGRPGILLSAITDRAHMDAVITLIFRETPSIGLRIHAVGRRKLLRRELVLPTSFGPVRAKVVGRDGGTVVTAEFEECKRLAQERNMPLAEVMRALNEELRSLSSSHPENHP